MLFYYFILFIYFNSYFTVNYEVLCIKNSIVFPYNYTMQPSQQPTQKKSLTGKISGTVDPFLPSRLSPTLCYFPFHTNNNNLYCNCSATLIE